MIDRLREYLSPPSIVEEDATHMAGLLRTALLGAIILAMLYGVLFPFMLDAPLPMMIALGVAVPLWLVAFIMLHQGRVARASVVCLSVLWVIATFQLLAYEGLEASATNLYVITVLVAGLLLGVRAAVVFSGLSIAVGLVLLLAHVSERYPKPIAEANTLAIWVGVLITLIYAVLLLCWTAIWISHILGRAQRNERDAIKNRRKLETEVEEGRQTEDALRREYDLVASILDTSPVGILMANRAGRIVFANAQAEHVLGLGKSAIMSRTCNDPEWQITDFGGNLIPEETLPFHRVVATGSPVIDARNAIMGRDGQRILLSISAAPVLDVIGNVDGMVCTVEDITERVSVEETLRVKERAITSSINGIAIADLDGNLLYVNDAFLTMWGYDSQEQVVGQPAIKFWREKRKAVEVGEALWSTDSWMGELEARRRDGTRFDVQLSASLATDATGQPISMMASFIDITERKRTEEALRASEQRFRSIIEHSPDGIILTDETGAVIEWNPGAERITGMGRAEVVGNLVWDIQLRMVLGRQPSVEIRQTKARLLEFFEKGQSDWLPRVEEIEIQRPDGSTRALQMLMFGIYTGHGRRLGSILRDITEGKKAEEEIRQRTTELEARNEELDAFAHTVAHDLQNPLGVIIGFAEALEQDVALAQNEIPSRYLRVIAQHGRKMANIIDELLLLSGVRQTQVVMAPLDMRVVVAEAQRRLADLIERHQAEIRVPNVWPRAMGHGPWVEEVWVNYLSNAIRYGGRPPLIALGAEVLAPVLSSQGTAEQVFVRFWVRDNGPGLTAEEHKRLFIPFTQLAQVRVEGYGLGLSIVSRIVDKLGGQVGVESKGVVGEGSLFYFTLPAAPGQSY